MTEADAQEDLSQSFNSQAVAVGVGGAVGAIGIACAIRIVDGIGRKRRPVAAVGVAGGVRIVRIGAQLAAIIALLAIEPWRVGRKWIRH